MSPWGWFGGRASGTPLPHCPVEAWKAGCQGMPRGGRRLPSASRGDFVLCYCTVTSPGSLQKLPGCCRTAPRIGARGCCPACGGCGRGLSRGVTPCCPTPGAPGGPAGAPAVRAADRGSEAELWRLVPCILHPCITRLTAQDATLLPHREPGRAQGSHPVCGGEALSSDVTLCCAPRCPWRPCRRIRSTRG